MFGCLWSGCIEKRAKRLPSWIKQEQKEKENLLQNPALIGLESLSDCDMESESGILVRLFGQEGKAKGVEFWGLLNPKWSHCNKGRRQSPVDINPDSLLYDPSLTAIHVNGDQITGQLVNTGRGLRFKVKPSLTHSSSSSHGHGSLGNSEMDPLTSQTSSSLRSSGIMSLSSASLQSPTMSSSVNHNHNMSSTITISAGPLSYEYTLHEILFHYGRTDERGSEHTINETSFPAEIQLYCYNSQLYNSWEESVNQPNGLAAIAVLVQLAKSASPSSPVVSNNQIRHLFHSIDSVKQKGTMSKVHKISLSHLIPNNGLSQYMTYEGSLTQPSCVETVQWIILNRPIYMTMSELSSIRSNILLEGQGEGNFRPTQAINSRSLRTNIWNGGRSASHKVSPTVSRIADPGARKNDKLDRERMKFCTSAGFIGYKANVASPSSASKRMMPEDARNSVV